MVTDGNSLMRNQKRVKFALIHANGKALSSSHPCFLIEIEVVSGNFRVKNKKAQWLAYTPEAHRDWDGRLWTIT